MVGLGDDKVVSRRAIVYKLSILDGCTTCLAVLVEASKLLAGDEEIKVALIEHPDGELAVAVGANVPVDHGIDVGRYRVAAQH